jgi:hypothetical protein
MIQMYNGQDQRFYGFSFIELVDGLSKLMVRGRTHKYIDQNLVNILLNILDMNNDDSALAECVTNAILNASFDDKVQQLLDSTRTIEIITATSHHSHSRLVQKNCEAILWRINRTPHRRNTFRCRRSSTTCLVRLSKACRVKVQRAILKDTS